MKVRRRITGVLCSLLESFGSRYSDFDGYWIFGQLLRESDAFSISLLTSDASAADSRVLAKAKSIARSALRAQIQRAHIPIECVADAVLKIRKLDGDRIGSVNGHVAKGFSVSISAEAVSDFGKLYTAEKFLFVALHDPNLEHRSVRRDQN